ncbi:hypothetical protein GCM10010392_69150 [Streptomyces clavifer]|nr:hypothetical protein GCM10010392_69150 [Streptomyces clavifer]
MQISFGTMTVQVNIFNVTKQPLVEDDGVFEVSYIPDNVAAKVLLVDPG